LSEKQLATMMDEAQKAYYNDSENVLMTDNEFDIIKEYMEKKYIAGPMKIAKDILLDEQLTKD